MWRTIYLHRYGTFGVARFDIEYYIKSCKRIVVNCFQMCIFAVALTSVFLYEAVKLTCELLSNVYLCSGINICFSVPCALPTVVNCFQMCIFAVALTSIPQDDAELV